MNNKTIEIGSNLFYGFYESIFCNSDEFIDYEIEDKNTLQKMLYCSNNKNIEVVYEYDDFNQYKEDVCTTFMQYYIDMITDILPTNLTNDKNFKFDAILEDIIVISPRYYNFTTDKCYCNVYTNNYTLNLIKEYTLNLPNAEQFILEHYTSYDGYISFLSSDIDDWKSKDIEDYEENMLIGLLDMLIILSVDDAMFKLNEKVYYDIEKITYTTPYCYYNDKEYTIYEFEQKIITKLQSQYPIALSFDIGVIF